jgi:hypothetical protein
MISILAPARRLGVQPGRLRGQLASLPLGGIAYCDVRGDNQVYLG